MHNKTKWTLDPVHSELGFKIKHLMITNVSGAFKDFKAEVETENEDFSTASIHMTADMASVYTNNAQRDEHLRNSDFFDVENYPALEFTSTRLDTTGPGQFELYGTLTLKGVSRPVKLNVENNGITSDPWGGERAGFRVTGKINRTDFGMNFNSVMEKGGLVLGEEVKIEAEIQLVKETIAIAV